MPSATVYAVSRGIVIEPRAMADARGELIKVCWQEGATRHEFSDAGFWWMRYGKHSLRIAAPFPTGAIVDLHWK